MKNIENREGLISNFWLFVLMIMLYQEEPTPHPSKEGNKKPLT